MGFHYYDQTKLNKFDGKTIVNFKRILSFDPGTNSFGLAVSIKNKKTCQVIWAGLLVETIKNLIEPLFNPEAEAFQAKIKWFIDKYKPDLIVAERYQNRGRFNGASGEKISLMLGIVYALAKDYKIPLMLIPASQWKNRFNTQFKPKNLKGLYEYLKPLPPHLLDASLIGWYGMFYEKGPINPYSNWTIDNTKSLIKFTPKKPERKKSGASDTATKSRNKAGQRMPRR